MTAVHPAASAAPSLTATLPWGTFHGTMIPTTPACCLRTIVLIFAGPLEASG